MTIEKASDRLGSEPIAGGRKVAESESKVLQRPPAPRKFPITFSEIGAPARRRECARHAPPPGPRSHHVCSVLRVVD